MCDWIFISLLFHTSASVTLQKLHVNTHSSVLQLMRSKPHCVTPVTHCSWWCHNVCQLPFLGEVSVLEQCNLTRIIYSMLLKSHLSRNTVLGKHISKGYCGPTHFDEGCIYSVTMTPVIHQMAQVGCQTKSHWIIAVSFFAMWLLYFNGKINIIHIIYWEPLI